MTLMELRYVMALAKERHFGRAAAVCNVSQPSLSVAVKKLESELGVKLFERRSQEIVPTRLGEEIIAEAAAVFERVRRIQTIARQGADPLAGPLRLGVIYTVSPYLLPGLIRAERETAPAMPLIFEENYTEKLLEMLKAGEIDAAVLALPVNEPNLVIAPIYDEEFIVAVPKGHRLAGARKLARSDLAGENLLLLAKGHCLRDQVLEFCPEAEPGRFSSESRIVNATSLFTIREMVAQGLGVTLLPASSASRAKSDGDIALASFAAPKPRRRVVLAWRRDFARVKAIDALRVSLSKVRLSGCRMLELPAVTTAD